MYSLQCAAPLHSQALVCISLLLSTVQGCKAFGQKLLQESILPAFLIFWITIMLTVLHAQPLWDGCNASLTAQVLPTHKL